MAQIFPIHSDASRSNAAPGPPIATLSRLPEPWTLLRDRRIGAPGAPVSLVLVHPQIGVALVDEAARDSAAGAEALRDLLARERFGEYFTGELPIVSLGIAWDEGAGLEQRLIGAFGAVPALSIADRDWADAVVELLLQPSDLAMVPIGPAATPAPIDPDAGGEAPPFSATATPETERPRCAEPEESGVNEHLFALVLRKRWRAGGPRRGRTMEMILTALVASVLTAAIGSFAPSQKTEAPVAPSPRAEIETAAAPPLAVPPAQAASVPVSSPHPRPPSRRIVPQARCADWLHQDRPGGSDYRGPPVTACRGASRRLPALRLF
jgi:hypothetical protein